MTNGSVNYRNMDKCLFCGGELSWDSQGMCCEVSPDYEGDPEAIVHFLHCRNCGRDYEIYDPPKDERKSDYKGYWNSQNEPKVLKSTK